MVETIKFTLNGKPISLKVDKERTLLWVLRTELGLTGTKYGCGEGLCGACMVHVDGDVELSCQTTIGGVAGAEVTTIEGLAKNGRLHPLQKAFIQHDALQCGYCTSGMIMKAHALLTDNPEPSREEIIQEMNENLCRCGAHMRIVEAIQTAAKEMKGGA
jgi:aerobic-type carbon monoxide dehydrogenase small subunit (CoxS/CutS family)